MKLQIPTSKYKDTIIKNILKNDLIVKALSHSKPNFISLDMPDNPSDLVHDKIFPYKHVPNIQEEAKTYITMAIQLKWDSGNRKVLRRIDIYLYVFAHQSQQRTDYDAIRIDMISNEIDKELNGSNCIGAGKLYLAELAEYQMAESEYSGVTMKYSVVGLNGQRIYN